MNRSFYSKLCLVILTLGSSLVLSDIEKRALAGGLDYAPLANPVNPAGSQGASGLDNASAVFYNPAAILRIDDTNQLVIRSDLTIVNPKFQDRGSKLAPGIPLTGGSASGRAEVLVPSLHASWRISDDVAVGLSVDNAFGLATLYPDDWAGRYQAIESRLSTVNINPAIGFQVTDELSAGVGINLQYATATSSNAIDFGSLIALAGAPPLPQQLDGLVEVSGDDWSWGWNAGILYQPTDATRIGLTYRSAISHNLRGNADFTVPDPAIGLTSTGAFIDSAATLNIDLPDIVSLGIYHQVSPDFGLAGQVDWTNWSRNSESRVSFDNPAQPDLVEPQNWHDTFRFSLGAVYDPSDQWRLRLGAAYDPSPVDSEFFSPRIPTGDQILLDLGATYRPTEDLGITARWLHVFITDTDINRTVPGAGTLVGNYSNSIDTFSLMLEYGF
jgi:long-chain fatty acid transport protein